MTVPRVVCLMEAPSRTPAKARTEAIIAAACKARVTAAHGEAPAAVAVPPGPAVAPARPAMAVRTAYADQTPTAPPVAPTSTSNRQAGGVCVGRRGMACAG